MSVQCKCSNAHPTKHQLNQCLLLHCYQSPHHSPHSPTPPRDTSQPHLQNLAYVSIHATNSAPRSTGQLPGPCCPPGPCHPPSWAGPADPAATRTEGTQSSQKFHGTGEEEDACCSPNAGISTMARTNALYYGYIRIVTHRPDCSTPTERPHLTPPQHPPTTETTPYDDPPVQIHSPMAAAQERHFPCSPLPSPSSGAGCGAGAAPKQRRPPRCEASGWSHRAAAPAMPAEQCILADTSSSSIPTARERL